MRRLYSVLVFAFVMGAATAACAEEKAENAPADDPRVVAARQIYESVESGAAGKLTEKKLTEWRCGNTKKLIIFSDTKTGRIKHVWNEVIEGATYTFRAYTSGTRLRFLFVSAVTADGKNGEFRIYYDEDGKQIREEPDAADGSNHSFPSYSQRKAALNTVCSSIADPEWWVWGASTKF